MASRKKQNAPLKMMISLGVTLAILGAGLVWVDHLQAATLGRKLVWPLARLMVFILLGLAVGQAIEAFGWTRRVAWLAGPMFRFGRLGDQCAAAFVTAFFSGAAANAMLYEFYQDGKICRTRLFLANFVNQLPVFFLHLPTTMFIVLPLTGWAGAIYFLLTFLAVILRVFFVLLFGRFRLDRGTCAMDQNQTLAPRDHGTGAGAWQTLRKKLPGRIMGVTTFVVPIYSLVYVINAAGFFTWARDALAHFVTSSFIPVEALSLVVVSFTAEFTSGFAAAGALMQSGVLSLKQAVAALIIGNVVAFPVRALRHQLPRYAGIFTPKLGTQILFLGQLFRVVSLLVVLAGFYLVV